MAFVSFKMEFPLWLFTSFEDQQQEEEEKEEEEKEKPWEYVFVYY
jgi:hypothetical protein